jgi:hypothetical protein
MKAKDMIKGYLYALKIVLIALSGAVAMNLFMFFCRPAVWIPTSIIVLLFLITLLAIFR